MMSDILEVAADLRLDFGTFGDGTPMLWDLNGPAPHALLLGTTGHGTQSANAASVLVTRLSRIDGVEVYPVVAGPVSLADIDDLPGVHARVWEPSDVVERLAVVSRAIQDRYQVLRDGGRRDDLAPLVLVLDDADALVERLAEESEGRGRYQGRLGVVKGRLCERHPSLSVVSEVLAFGAQVRVHLLALTGPRPSSFGAPADQFAVRVACSELDLSGELDTFGMYVDSTRSDRLPGGSWASMTVGAVPRQGRMTYLPNIDVPRGWMPKNEDETAAYIRLRREREDAYPFAFDPTGAILPVEFEERGSDLHRAVTATACAIHHVVCTQRPEPCDGGPVALCRQAAQPAVIDILTNLGLRPQWQVAAADGTSRQPCESPDEAFEFAEDDWAFGGTPQQRWTGPWANI